MRPEIRNALLSGAGMGLGCQIGFATGAQWGLIAMLIGGFIGSALGDLTAHAIAIRLDFRGQNDESPNKVKEDAV